MKIGFCFGASTFVLTLGLASATTGCKGCRNSDSTETASTTGAADAAPKPAPTATSDSGAPRAPWQAVPSATAPLLPNMSIAERFEIEQKNRPTNAKPNVEAMFGALEKAGLVVVDKKQHLAQTFGARYCVGARVVNGKTATDPTLLQISACEYVSAELAQASAPYSTEVLKQIPNRAVHARGQTTLTVRGEAPMTPDVEAATRKAFAAYDSL